MDGDDRRFPSSAQVAVIRAFGPGKLLEGLELGRGLSASAICGAERGLLLSSWGSALADGRQRRGNGKAESLLDSDRKAEEEGYGDTTE